MLRPGVLLSSGSDREISPPLVGSKAMNILRRRRHDPREIVWGLREVANPSHRPYVEHDQYTLLIHLGDEEGYGSTMIAGISEEVIVVADEELRHLLLGRLVAGLADLD